MARRSVFPLAPVVMRNRRFAAGGYVRLLPGTAPLDPAPAHRFAPPREGRPGDGACPAREEPSLVRSVTAAE